MIIIGEKLNSSIPRTKEAYESSPEAVKQLIKLQSQAGADYLDINTATCNNEYGVMVQTIDLVKRNCSCGIVLDSPSPEILIKASDFVGERPLIINSVATYERLDELSDLIASLHCGVICMPTDKRGVPQDADGRVKNAGIIIDRLAGAGVSASDIYIDILVQSVALEPSAANVALETVTKIKKCYPGVKTVAGASNVSYGLPKRANINSAFLICASYAGLDCAITDITSPSTLAAIRSADVISGNDEYCLDYISYIRGE